jgi:hypothetical protein
VLQATQTLIDRGARCLVVALANVEQNPANERAVRRIVKTEYPGIAARRLIGYRSYKSDNKKKQTEEQHRARIDLWKLLTGYEGKAMYGF